MNQAGFVRKVKINLVLFGLLLLWTVPKSIFGQERVPDEVLDIFDAKCAFAGCHAGANAPKNLDLTEEFAFASLVNQASAEKPNIMRVKPQDPSNSYLVMKLNGSPGIKGDRMPRGKGTLSEAEMSAIVTWINSVPKGTKGEAPVHEYAEAFSGLTLSTLPTTETLEPGKFSYRISHRFRGEVDSGFANWFGLDAGAHMFTQLDFAVTADILFNVARSSENATFEFGAKWRFMREKTDGSVPLSLAIVAGLDWQTIKGIVDPENPDVFLSRTDGERFNLFAQVPLSKQISKRISVLLVPGVLINGNPYLSGEDAIFTLGFGGKFMMFPGFSIFAEGVPIFSGDDGANTIGGPRAEGGNLVFNDAFTLGFERKIGGHVFHIYVTNSLGLATNQYMSGGNLDFADGDFRLGFNIYRVLRLPF